jgi:glutaredoxin-related protein
MRLSLILLIIFTSFLCLYADNIEESAVDRKSQSSSPSTENSEVCKDISQSCTNEFVNAIKLIDYNTFSFPKLKAFPSSQSDSNYNIMLTLVSAGMRRKSLFIIEVDVYTVGIYFSNEKLEQFASLRNSVAQMTMTEKGNYIGARPSENSSNDVYLGIVLKFVRHVGTNKVVDAIVEALTLKENETSMSHVEVEEYNTSLKIFSDLLLSSIGNQGMAKDDEIMFTFYQETNIGVVIQNELKGSVSHSYIKRKLIDIYLGEKAVAPQVYTVLSRKLWS